MEKRVAHESFYLAALSRPPVRCIRPGASSITLSWYETTWRNTCAGAKIPCNVNSRLNRQTSAAALAHEQLR